MSSSSPSSPVSPSHGGGGGGAHEQQQQQGAGAPHDARWSQYAENQANPMPELVVNEERAPEPLSNLDHVNCAAIPYDNDDDDDDEPSMGRPVIQPDLGDRRSAAVVYAEPDRSWIAKHKSWVISGLIVAVIILVGVVVGVVVTGRHSSADRASTSSTPGPASSTQASSTSGTSTSPTGPSTSVHSSCTPSNYVTKVNFMGIASAEGGWDVQYPGATDAAGCCSACYGSTPKGCDGWSFIPGASGSTTAACAVIDGWPGDNNDSTCPEGHTAVKFAQLGDNASHVGGVGPCATVV